MSLLGRDQRWSQSKMQRLSLTAPSDGLLVKPTLISISSTHLRTRKQSRIVSLLPFSKRQLTVTRLYQTLPSYDGEIAEEGFGLSTSIGNLLDAIDGSFCTDEDKAVGQDCGIYSPTRVTSISYGASEVYYPEAQQQRQCHEFLKLGLKGHTFAISSGDYGVSDRPAYLYDTNGCIIPGNYNATTYLFGPKLNGTVFNPPYPQNCPYVLSVGGTQLNPDETVLDPEVVMYQPQITQLNVTGLLNPPATFSSGG